MESLGKPRLGALLLLLLLSWESAAFVLHEPLEEEVSQMPTWRGRACSTFTLRNIKLTVKANIANILARVSFPCDSSPSPGEGQEARWTIRWESQKLSPCPTGPHATPATHGGHQLPPAGRLCDLPELGAVCAAGGGCPGPGLSSGTGSGQHGSLRFGAASRAVRRLVPPPDASAPQSGPLLP